MAHETFNHFEEANRIMTLATLKASKFVEKVMLSGNVMYLKE